MNDHVISIPVSPTRNPALNKLLAETGSLPFEESGAGASSTNSGSIGTKLESSNGATATAATSADNKSKIQRCHER